MLDLTQKQFLKHVIVHPFEGFEDLRWKKSGSMKIAWGIVTLLFVYQVLHARFYGFQYYQSYEKIFNVIPYFFRSYGVFIAWVTANWAMCTLFDGEGTMKRIFINSAYAILPFILCGFAEIILSHIFVRDEAVFLQMLFIFSIIWSGTMMISAMKAVHQFSLGKTLALILLTLVAMVAMIFLLVLLLTLFQQMLIFIFSIYTEIAYRVRS